MTTKILSISQFVNGGTEGAGWLLRQAPVGNAVDRFGDTAELFKGATDSAVANALSLEFAENIVKRDGNV